MVVEDTVLTEESAIFIVGALWNLPFRVRDLDFCEAKLSRFLNPQFEILTRVPDAFLSRSALESASISTVTSSAYATRVTPSSTGSSKS
ncbi:unnamed protein product, partial [Iphiclides podalirius]